jgi:hypothetical protein
MAKSPDIQHGDSIKVPISCIIPHPDNAQEMTPDEFSLLMVNIERYGVLEYPLVVPHKEKGKPEIRYQIVSGEHRWSAAQKVGLEEIPVIVADPKKITPAEHRKQLVRFNKIKGHLNIERFNALVEKMVAAGELTLDEAAFELGFADENEFQLMLEAARESLPTQQMRQEFDDWTKNAKTVEDITDIVQRLLQKYGDTVPANFMVIDVGRKKHLWIKVSPKEIKDFEQKGRDCLVEGVTFDSALVHLLKKTDFPEFVKKYKKVLSPLVTPDQEIDDVFTEDPFDEEPEENLG